MHPDAGNGPDSQSDRQVSEREARHELDRILADPDFHCAERNRRFLRFVADEFFCGRETGVKAYTIAVDVFGRASTFDPSTDPIVRIEATRLRSALIQYYELHGQKLPVRIDLPKGRYVPVFTRTGTNPDLQVPAGGQEYVSDTEKAGGGSRLYSTLCARWFSVGLGVAGGLCLAALLAGFSLFIRTQPLPVSEKPSLAIDIRPSEALSKGGADRLRDALVMHMSDFQTLHIIAQEMTTASTGATTSSQASAPLRSRYRLHVKYEVSAAAEPMLWWMIVDDASGEALRSGNEQLRSRSDLPLQALPVQLAVRLASARGAISILETARELDRPSLGNGCVLRSMPAIQSRDQAALAEVRTCLEKTLVLRPNDADAYAALAAVQLAIDPVDMPTDLSRKAADNADRAVLLAPDSDRVFVARMKTQFRMGNSEAAIEAGRHALELNPNNPATIAQLAAILFVSGDWNSGSSLALSQRLRGIASEDTDMTLAFDAYRRGQFDEALLRLRRLNRFDCYKLQVLTIATLGQLGRSEEANAVIAELRASRPRFEATFRHDFQRRQFAPVLIELIQEGLVKIGLKFA